jgi:hypothetical protein
MKTKELIAQLQKEDPTGETEVIVDGSPIYSIENQPAYYDGPLKVLIQDHSLDPYYNIVGFKYVRGGNKIRISTMSLDDCLCDNPDLPVDTSELSEGLKSYYEESIAAKRIKYTKLEKELNETK